jgi:hypothetical protein
MEIIQLPLLTDVTAEVEVRALVSSLQWGPQIAGHIVADVLRGSPPFTTSAMETKLRCEGEPSCQGQVKAMSTIGDVDNEKQSLFFTQ